MDGQPEMFVLMLLNLLLIVAVVGTMRVALWRTMKAHESIARSLEGVERALRERP